MGETGEGAQSSGNQRPDSSSAPAGWYTSTDGSKRFWDGQTWQSSHLPDDPTSPLGSLIEDEKDLAILIHVSAIVTLFFGPLVIWILKRKDSEFVDFHGKQALDFELTVLIFLGIATVLKFLFIGYVLIPIVWIMAIVLNILAAVAASEGKRYKYPIALRLIK
jgi:uncharacterized Tic20 family protein